MVTSLLVRGRATHGDLRSVPDHQVGEILDGDLYASPRPASPHALASSALGTDIGARFQRGWGGPGGWWILDEPELHFGEDVLVPDLAGWRQERMPAIPAVPYFELAPDWVCEVVSPGTERLDRALKLPAYARSGVAHAWLVNPLARTLEVLRREGRFWVMVAVHAGDGPVRAEPFDAVEIELGALWIGPAEAP